MPFPCFSFSWTSEHASQHYRYCFIYPASDKRIELCCQTRFPFKPSFDTTLYCDHTTCFPLQLFFAAWLPLIISYSNISQIVDSLKWFSTALHNFLLNFLKHKASFGKSEYLSKIFFAEILVFDHDYEGKSSSSNGLLWISFIFFK